MNRQGIAKTEGFESKREAAEIAEEDAGETMVRLD